MMKSFTRDELVNEWRLRRHLEPQRSDVTVEYDGAGMEKLIEAEVDDWWDMVLDTVPADWLEEEDYADYAMCRPTADMEGLEVTLPAQKPLRRPFKIQLEGWLQAATIVSGETYEMELERNPFGRHGIVRPIAVRHSPYRYVLYPLSGLELKELKGVSEGDGKTYRFDSRCLKLMNDRNE